MNCDFSVSSISFSSVLSFRHVIYYALLKAHFSKLQGKNK